MTLSATTSTVPSTSASAARWVIDGSHSSVGFSVRHMMITNVRGEFEKLSGELTYDPRAPEATKLTASIEVASINTREPKRDEHLKSADFFDAEKFPTLTFEARRVSRKGEGLEVVGDLSVHGVTREVTLSVQDLTSEHNDPWGNKRIGASARTKIKRSEFGMTWNAALEAGNVLVGDEVTISIEVSLIKQ
jgi:polyisoprenoid-binding protein YceI